MTQFTKTFANVRLDGLSEDENDIMGQDPMEDNKDSFMYDSSLFIFHIDSKIRRFCLELSETHADY